MLFRNGIEESNNALCVLKRRKPRNKIAVTRRNSLVQIPKVARLSRHGLDL